MENQKFDLQQQAQPQMRPMQTGAQLSPETMPARMGAQVQDSTPPQKRKNIVAIAVIAITVVLLVVAIVAIAMAANNKPTEKPDEPPSPDKKVTNKIDDDPESYSPEDVGRNKALKRLVSATKSYQDANGGKTPFDGVTKMGERFVQRYIDASCVTSVDNGEEVRFTSCGQGLSEDAWDASFIVNKGSTDGLSFDSDGGADISKSVEEEKGFYVYSNARCGGGGTLTGGDSNREVAIFAKLTTGEIICRDNWQ